MKKFAISILFIFLLAGCNSNLFASRQDKIIDEIDNKTLNFQYAKLSLSNFLSLLNLGQYQQALSYFQGDFNYLASLNLESNQNDKAELLKRFCTVNGGKCLKFMIINQEELSANEYQYTVQFLNNDGAVYATPGCPCKGGGKTQFYFKVKKITEGQFVVTDLPPKE
jgi:hypothetical protein